MFCTRCGAEVEAGDKFCSRCGNETPAAAEMGAVAPEAAAPAAPEVASPEAVGAVVEAPEPAGEPDAPEENPAETAAFGAAAPDADDSADEVFIGGAASAAVAEQAAESAQPARAGEFSLPDSAFEPQTRPEPPAPSQTYPTVQVVAPPLPEDGLPAPSPKRKRGPVIAAAVAAVVLVAAVAVGAFFFLNGSDETVQAEPTRCSLVTLVVPEDEDGQPYSRYRATLKDPSGVVVSTLDVEGDGGFKLGDLTSEDGDYVLEISDPDTGAVLQQVPIRTDPADTTPVINPKPGKAEPASASADTTAASTGAGTGQGSTSSPAEGGSAAETGEKSMNEAYLEVVEQRMDTYGNANVLWYKDEPNMLSGVCVAELVDFNDDQQDELVVAYYDKAVADQKATDTWRPEYSVEVYTFNDSKVKRAYAKKVTLATDDPVGLDIVQPAGADMKPMIVERTGTEDNQETTYFALEEPDSFQAVSTVSLETDAKGKVTCKVGGEDATVEEYQEVVNRYEEGCERTVYRFDVGDQTDGEAADPEPAGEGSSSSATGSSSAGSADADGRPVAPEPASTRVVKCADELSTIDDTLATLRSDDQDPSSSGADKPETVATEAAAREAIGKAAGADPVQLFWADFDGDGTFEAFGIVGEQRDDEVVALRGQGISVWFVAKDKAERVGGDIDVAGVVPSQLQSGDVRFLKIVPDFDGRLDESQAVYLGVKDGAVVDLAEDEVNKALR